MDATGREPNATRSTTADARSGPARSASGAHPLKIVFDVSSCAKAQRKGIANYGASLVQAAAVVAPEHELVLAVRPHRWTKRRYVEDILPGARVRLLLDGPGARLLGADVDVLHGIGVRLPATDRFAKVVTLHDTNVFEFPELSSPEWLAKRRARIQQTVARADLVLAMSRQGQRAITEHVGVPAERIRVVPEGVDLERFRPAAPEDIARVTAKLGLDDLPYVLCIGTDDGRKNHGGLLEAFAHAGLHDRMRLVLAGPKGERAAALKARARELGLPDDRLALTGWVEDDDLPRLLAGATLYACASLHEGFGLPVLEAQACGVPVACSDRAALPETLGDCGVLFDPEDIDAFAAALTRLADDDALRTDLARRGPQRVQAHYSWARVAQQTLAAHAEAVALR